MITSPDNPRVRLARALLERRGREQQERCLIEGVRLIEEAMRAGVHPALVFCAAPRPRHPRVAALLADVGECGAPVLELAPEVFGTLSDTVTSQGVIAVLPIPRPVPAAGELPVLVLDQVRDPGNLGAILRSAAAAGVRWVILVPGCVDPWAPKVLRAGMGAHFRLALDEARDWTGVAQRLAGRAVWLADAGGVVTYDAVDWTADSALVIGGETLGLSSEAAALASGRVAIPMAAGAESLNAAMAATVILFEAARQWRVRGAASAAG